MSRVNRGVKPEKLPVEKLTWKERCARFAAWRAGPDYKRPAVPKLAELRAICNRWDLDVMTPAELSNFGPPKGAGQFKAWARALFYPHRPLHYKRVARQLVRMALLREKMLTYRNPGPFRADYEARYRRLPKWAKWRIKVNVLACVQDGKKFRKKPRRRM